MSARLTAIFLFLFAAQAAHAVPGPARKAPLSPAEMTALRTEMAENLYAIRKDDKTLSSLVTAYEEQIGAACLASLQRSPYYRGHPTEKSCTGIIEKTLAIDPENPMAICARDGIDAASCIDASTGITISTFNPLSGSGKRTTKDEKSLNARVAALSSAEKVEELESQFRRAWRSQETSKDPVAGAKLTELVNELMKTVCTSSYVELSTAQEVTAKKPGGVPTPSHQERAAARSIFDVGAPDEVLDPSVRSTPAQKNALDDLAERFGDKPTPRPSKLGEKRNPRSRVITFKCMQYVTRALTLDKYSAAAICHRDGWYSPNCVKARRIQRNPRSKSDAAKGVPVNPEEFSTF